MKTLDLVTSTPGFEFRGIPYRPVVLPRQKIKKKIFPNEMSEKSYMPSKLLNNLARFKIDMQ